MKLATAVDVQGKKAGQKLFMRGVMGGFQVKVAVTVMQ